MKHNPIIVALDTSSSLKALNLVHKLKVTGVAFKVGYELFLSGGRRLVEKIVNQDVRVFLDLKFHDIPNTVAEAASVATRMGVWMFNIHASGGIEMMARAKEASLKVAAQNKIHAPLLMGVTVLTSLSNLKDINVSLSIEEQVLSLASKAQEASLDGVVCSAMEAPLLKKKMGEKFCLVTPGIRLPGEATHDQKRVVSPQEALKNGSHYLVMGRPITESSRPMKTLGTLLHSLNLRQ